MFKVRFNTEEEGLNPSVDPWAPEGCDAVCGEREARRRVKYLLGEGKAERPVNGRIPWLIEVVDEEGELVYSITTEDEILTENGLEHERSVGKWAQAKAA